MPEARDRLSRPVDVAEMYRRRLTQIGGGRGRGAGRMIHVFRDDADELAVGTPFRWGAIGLTGTPGAGSAAAAPAGGVGTPVRRTPFRTPSARRGRRSAARVIGRENISQTGRRQVRARDSVLPSWYPRRPLQDITYISRAYQRRRERLREGEDEQPGTPLLRDQTALDPSAATPGAQLEHNNPMITPFPTLRSRLCPPSVHKLPKILIDVADQNAQDWEFLTPQKKLLNSIETVEKVFKEELQKLKRTPSAKKAEREKRVRTLMSMR